ncbi:Ada metal-binding domain-containing protein [Flavivirga rizhaonensis]|uniref:Metal-binding protein n=1 Tax=Flavivirga rizhaonensis TaxID=2559571 RepID=A0A4S1E194_9FLAO|nr:Ada metal-binding domain-containing protein [Flavivirga rizhaonensis]TGV04300.1 metal-binding protein [Flavivirga rizhaonensis]
MIMHNNISKTDLKTKIKTKQIRFAGNNNLKIYGKLNCKSGKRMKQENRVFFSTVKEALKNNFRPCGHCMKEDYKKWKNEIV